MREKNLIIQDLIKKTLSGALFLIGIAFLVSAGIDYFSEPGLQEKLEVTEVKVPYFDYMRSRSNSSDIRIKNIDVVQDEPNLLRLKVDYHYKGKRQDGMSACGGVHNNDYGYEWSCRPVSVYPGENSLILQMQMVMDRAAEQECSAQVAVRVYENSGDYLFVEYYDYPKLWLKNQDRYSNKQSQFRRICQSHLYPEGVEALPITDKGIAQAELEYINELANASDLPDWWDDVDVPDELYKVTDVGSLMSIRDQILPEGCCINGAYEQEWRVVSKVMYQIARDNYARPDIASEALYFVITRSVKGWNNIGIWEFYNKYFYNEDSTLCVNCGKADKGWSINRRLANEYSQKGDHVHALYLIDKYDQKRGSDIHQRYKYDVVNERMKLHYKKGDHEKAIKDAEAYLHEQITYGVEENLYRAHNKLVYSCQKLQDGACSDFERLK